MTDRAFTAAIVLALGIAIGVGLIGWRFASATELQNLQVSDSNTSQYQRDNAGPRFVIQQTVMVRLNKPEVVRAASQRVSELVSAGVVLSQGGEYGVGGPTFVFTRLNDLKPAIIAEATANARAAADQFARDSDSGFGGIRQANQGVFVILPRDQAPGINEGRQLQKIVRVVSTFNTFSTDHVCWIEEASRGRQRS